MFNYFKNYCLIKESPDCFPTCCTILHACCQSMRVPISPHSGQHLLLTYFLSLAILAGVQWYFTVGMVCMCLMNNDVKHVFMCLLAIYLLSSLDKDLFRSFLYFSAGLFIFLLLKDKHYFHKLNTNLLSGR